MGWMRNTSQPRTDSCVDVCRASKDDQEAFEDKVEQAGSSGSHAATMLIRQDRRWEGSCGTVVYC